MSNGLTEEGGRLLQTWIGKKVKIINDQTGKRTPITGVILGFNQRGIFLSDTKKASIKAIFVTWDHLVTMKEV